MSVEPFGISKPLTPPEEILSKLFRPTGVDGVHLRTGAYEDIVEALGRYITSLRPRDAEVYRFPPVVSRKLIEKSGYLKSFPNLLGCVCCLEGSEADIRRTVARFADGESWIGDLQGSDVVLTPAGCYPIYPIAAARGAVPDAGWTFDVG